MCLSPSGSATLWVPSIVQFPLASERRQSLVSPRSFRMGLEPLYKASLHVLPLEAQLLVFLPEAACSSLCGVRHLSRVWSSVCGPLGVAYPLHPSLLLGGVPVRFCGALADGLLRCPTCALRFSLHRSRVSIPFALSPLTPYLRWLYPSFARGRSCDGGVSPCGGFRRSP